MKKRLGESRKGDEREDEKWFAAYNSLNPMSPGISMEDFETGRDIIMGIMQRKSFMKLLGGFMERMRKYSKETQAKYRE